MRLKIEQFLRNFGIRTSGELLRPRLLHLAKLKLPHESVYHFLDGNTAVNGPSQNDPLISRYRGKVFIEHVTKLEVKEGNPVRTTAMPTALMSEFRRNNRFFKPLRKDEAVRLNSQNVAVFNYNMLNRLYRYHTNLRSGYARWRNINNTFWHGIKDVGERYNWNQFIELELPDKMPTYAEFRRLERGITKEILNIFNNDTILNLAEVIKFYGDYQAESNIYQILSPTLDKDEVTITREVLDKVNILIRVRNTFFILNMGKVYDFRDSEETVVSTETFIDSFGMEASFKPNILQLKLISLFTTLTEFNNGGDVGLIEEESKPEGEINPETGEVEIKQPVEPEMDSDDDLDEVEEPDEIEETVEAEEETTVDEPSIDESEIIEKKVVTTLTKTIDLDSIEIKYAPPPESELEETVLIVEKDPLEELEKGDINIEVDTKNVNGVQVAEEMEDPYTKEIAKRAYEMVNAGAISPRTYEQVIENAKTFLSLEDPYGSGKTLAEAMVIEPELLEIPKVEMKTAPGVSDESMAHEVHRAMKRKYVEDVLPKDIMDSIVSSVQSQGVSILNIKQELVEDSLNRYRNFSVTVKPITGRQSTIHFRVPEIDADGRFLANGVTYSQRTQVGDIPIRKVRYDKVALTSYYSKLFVNRSDKNVDDYDRWLGRTIVNLTMQINPDTNKEYIKHVSLAAKDLSKYKLPRAYTALARQFDLIILDDLDIFLNYETRLERCISKHGETEAKKIDKANQIYIGNMKRGNIPLVMLPDGVIYKLIDKDLDPLGTIVEILDLDLSKAPLEHVTLSVYNKHVPIGLIFAFRYGLTNLLERLNIQYQTHQRGTRLNLNHDEYTLIFMDEVLVFNRDDYKTLMILAGIKKYQKQITRFSRWDFDRKDVYFRLLNESGLSANHIRELETLFTSWIDPITKGILEDMKEPTEFDALLMRAIEMLLDDWSPSEVDGAYLRYKGYERIAGAIYNQLSKSVKVYNARQGRGEQQITMDPYEVWRVITRDPTVSVVEDSNPIQNIREQEVVTFSGEGGRSSQTLVARTRVFHENDMGVVSPDTVDSGNTGAIFYLTPDANFKNIRGVTKPFDSKKDGAAKVLSTTGLLSVGGENDDTKRVIFTGTQHAQAIHGKGYEVSPLRTGYESVIAQRTSGIFATSARSKGEVTNVTKSVITVKYEDGKVEKYKLGKTHGSAAGTNYPYELKTSLKVGDKVSTGETIVYNNSFFKEDRYTLGLVNWKAGVMGRIAFIDNMDTLEDGSVISERMAKELETEVAEIRTITLRFDQVLSELVKVGDKVDLDSILCVIQDEEVASMSTDDEVSETLKRLSSNTPRAKFVGVISKIECFYHGDYEDMNESTLETATYFDKIREKELKELGLPVTTGEDDGSMRIRGKMLEPFNMALRIYIDRDLTCGTGDKLVFFNQMKSVISKVMTGKNYCEDGTPLDIQFAKTAIDARQVVSPNIQASTNLLLKSLTKHVVNLYKGNTNARAK